MEHTQDKARFVRLPNDNVVRVDRHGRIEVFVQVELSDFVNHDLEGVLDILSEAATGTETLSDISYSVVGHQGNTLRILVCGDIDLIDDVEELDVDQMPMLEFEVEVTRVGYGNRTYRLSAKTADDAMDIADDDAGNHTYSEHSSHYIIDARQVQA